MSTAFFGISLASNAMRAFQYAMYTTSHNIANVNTPGYSRQTTDLTESLPYEVLGKTNFFTGGGVDVASVSRIRDSFLSQRYVQASSDDGRFSTLSSNLKLVETSFGDLSSSGGISGCLDNFFNSFQALSANPSDPSARVAVRQAADALATRFRSLSSDLVSQQTNIGNELQANITQLNDLASQVAALNKQIVTAAASGAQPNDQMDQRDQLINEMAGLADVRTSVANDGSVQVYLNQHTLVDQGGARPLGTAVDVATGSVIENGRHIAISSGAISGDIQSLQKIAGYSANLNTLATNIINQVNAIHATGFALDGTQGHLLFSGTSASNFDLSAEVKQNVNNIVAAGTNAAGDGSLALAISNLRDQAQAGLGGQTYGQYYVGLASAVGVDASAASAGLSAQDSLRAQIDAQAQSVSGVSLDDEMTNMLKYQRSYEAAAKMLSIMDTVLQETIAMFGQ